MARPRAPPGSCPMPIPQSFPGELPKDCRRPFRRVMGGDGDAGDANESRTLPAVLKPSLLLAAFAAILLAGCTSATLDADGVAGPGYSYAGAAAALPDTMAIPANSFARSPAPEGAALAALEHAGEFEQGFCTKRSAYLLSLVAQDAEPIAAPDRGPRAAPGR